MPKDTPSAEIVERLKESRRAFLKNAVAITVSGIIAATAPAAPVWAKHAIGCSGCGALPQGFFPSGHWVVSPVATLNPSNQTATQIYPRPDSETAAWARHHWMYYDGVTNFVNRIPIGVRCGAFPYVYEIIAAPSNAGATMGASYWHANWTFAQALAADYGMLLVQPTGTFSAGTFTVRVWDQTFSYNDVTFTAGTVAGYQYNATTPSDSYGFIFQNPSAAADPTSYPSTTGLISTINSPIKTLNWAFGATLGTQTYPNATLVSRAGTTGVFAQNATFGIQPVVNASPMSIINMPGETVNIDLTNAGSNATTRSCAFDIQTNGSDMLFQGLNFINGPSGAVNFHVILSEILNHRLVVDNCTQFNAWSGTAPTDNASLLTLLEVSGPRNYIYQRGFSESNRTDSAGGSGTEAFAFYVMGNVQYGLAELCTSTGTGSYGPWWKWNNTDVTLRCCEIVFAAGFKQPSGSADFEQVSNGNMDICHCILDGSLVSSGGHGWALGWNLSEDAFADKLHASFRNSIKGCIDVDAPSSNSGTFSSTNDAIEYGYGDANQPIMISRANTAPPGNVQNTGTTSQGKTAGSIFNSGTYTLVNSARLGLDGATIA